MAKPRVSIFDKLMFLVASLAAIALILGAFAGIVDPREYVFMAFFGIAYPFVLLFNLIFLAIWLIKKKWGFAILTFAVILCGINTLNATYKFSGEAGEKVKSADAIRIMTYNVHSFKEYGSENDAGIKKKFLQVIKDENPDIICFQEFYTRFKGEFNTSDSIKAILKTPYFYFVPASKNSYEATGLAIFSKFPIKNKNFIAFEATFGGNSSIYIDVEINSKLLRIYNIHLRSISFEKQDYSYLDKVTKEIKPDKQSSKRIYRMLRSAFKKRAAHVELMKAELKNCPYPYIIVGDFNDTPASYAVNQLVGSINNSFVAQGQGFGKTYNGKFPNFQIDYIAATKNIEVLNYHITEAKLSDHFPVRADVRMK